MVQVKAVVRWRGLCHKGLARGKYAVPDVPGERLFGYDVNLDSEEILQVFLEFDVVKKVSAPVPGHEEIRIAARSVVTALRAARDRPEAAETSALRGVRPG